MKLKTTVFAGLAVCALLLGGCANKAPDTPKDTASPAPTAAPASDSSAFRFFLSDAVPDADETSVLQAGVGALGAEDRQAYHFSVVTDQELLMQISEDMNSGASAQAAPRPTSTSSAGNLRVQEPVRTTSSPANISAAPREETAASGGTTTPANLTVYKKTVFANAPLIVILSCKEGAEANVESVMQGMITEAQRLGYGAKTADSPLAALNGEKQAEYRTLLGIPEDMSSVGVLLIGKPDPVS